MARPHRLGDVVRLKSGGPPMTVMRFQRGHLECVWWDGACLRRRVFPVQVLTEPERIAATVGIA